MNPLSWDQPEMQLPARYHPVRRIAPDKRCQLNWPVSSLLFWAKIFAGMPVLDAARSSRLTDEEVTLGK